MSEKKIAIAFPSGAIVPGSVLGKDAEDKKVKPHETVKVAETYGLQMIKDRRAYDPVEKGKADKEAAKKTAAQSKAAADGKDVKALKAELQKLGAANAKLETANTELATENAAALAELAELNEFKRETLQADVDHYAEQFAQATELEKPEVQKHLDDATAALKEFEAGLAA